MYLFTVCQCVRPPPEGHLIAHLMTQTVNRKEPTPHYHRIHDEAAIHTRHAHTPGPARLKTKSTTSQHPPATPEETLPASQVQHRRVLVPVR